MACSVAGCPNPVHAKGMCNMHYRRFRRYGAPGGVGPLRVKVTAGLEDKVTARYKDGLSMDRIADELGIGHGTVGAILNRRCPKSIRPQYNALGLDETFFDRFSPEMAWCLGWLWTDGCLTKQSSVELASNDLDVLEKFRKAVKGKQKISWSEDKKRGYRFSRYRFNSVYVASKLRQLGMTERKSLVVRFPAVPKEHLRHFLRGVFEGDGSVKPNGTGVAVTICTASSAMKDGLMRALIGFGLRPICHKEEKTIVRKQVNGRLKTGKHHLWVIAINRIADIQNFYNIIYGGVPSDIRMDRKHDRYLKLLKKYWASRGGISTKAVPLTGIGEPIGT